MPYLLWYFHGHDKIFDSPVLVGLALYQSFLYSGYGQHTNQYHLRTSNRGKSRDTSSNSLLTSGIVTRARGSTRAIWLLRSTCWEKRIDWDIKCFLRETHLRHTYFARGGGRGEDINIFTSVNVLKNIRLASWSHRKYCIPLNQVDQGHRVV